jgi:hypothetical protein
LKDTEIKIVIKLIFLKNDFHKLEKLATENICSRDDISKELSRLKLLNLEYYIDILAKLNIIIRNYHPIVLIKSMYRDLILDN